MLFEIFSGRDIALSSNQSPVLKFYNVTYPDHYNRTLQFQGELYPVRGIQLWNDWNFKFMNRVKKLSRNMPTTHKYPQHRQYRLHPLIIWSCAVKT